MEVNKITSITVRDFPFFLHLKRLIQSQIYLFLLQYVRVSHDTDVQLILKLMLERWNLEIPNLVISVTGGAKSFVLKPRLKEVFRRGLIKAAKSTSAWIITGL